LHTEYLFIQHISFKNIALVETMKVRSTVRMTRRDLITSVATCQGFLLRAVTSLGLSISLFGALVSMTTSVLESCVQRITIMTSKDPWETNQSNSILFFIKRLFAPVKNHLRKKKKKKKKRSKIQITSVVRIRNRNVWLYWKTSS